MASSHLSCFVESPRFHEGGEVLTYRAPRATWVQTELFLTFPVPIIKSITLQPLTSPETGGRFRVWIMTPEGVHLAWDRKVSLLPRSTPSICVVSFRGIVVSGSKRWLIYRPRVDFQS